MIRVLKGRVRTTPSGGRIRGSRSKAGLALLITGLLVGTIPGSAWLYQATSNEDLFDAAKQALWADSRVSVASSGWVHDQDGDKLDDRIQYFTGRKSLLVAFDGPLDTAETRELLALPEIVVLHQFRQVAQGAWILLPLDHVTDLAALPFVTYVELDVAMEPQLDFSRRQAGAQDSRSGVYATGLEAGEAIMDGFRGAWRGNPHDGYEGTYGKNTTIALIDGGVDMRHIALDDMNDDGLLGIGDKNGDGIDDDVKVLHKFSTWNYVACTAVNATYNDRRPLIDPPDDDPITPDSPLLCPTMISQPMPEGPADNSTVPSSFIVPALPNGEGCLVGEPFPQPGVCGGPPFGAEGCYTVWVGQVTPIPLCGFGNYDPTDGSVCVPGVPFFIVCQAVPYPEGGDMCVSTPLVFGGCFFICTGIVPQCVPTGVTVPVPPCPGCPSSPYPIGDEFTVFLPDTNQDGVPDAPSEVSAPTNPGDMNHATSLAGVLLGTGDTSNALNYGSPADPNEHDPWAYAGLAPGAWLADVNAYVGFDHDCYRLPTGATVCSGDLPIYEPVADLTGQDLGGSAGSSRGLRSDGIKSSYEQAAQDLEDDDPDEDSLAERVAPTSASIATAADTIAQFNIDWRAANHSAGAIDIAVIPFVDPSTCGRSEHIATFTDAAIDALVQAPHNVTVIVSVGNGHVVDGEHQVCSPATVASVITVGALDTQRTIERDDDEVWPDSDYASADQRNGAALMAKPELLAPGVNVHAPRSRPTGGLSDYWDVTGSSVAAAHAAGAAALVLATMRETGAAGHDVGMPFAIKEALLQTGYAFPDEGSRFKDETGGGGGSFEGPDGLSDGDPQAGWHQTTGFASLDVRGALCTLSACPMPWEALRSELYPDTDDSTIVSIGSFGHFNGTVRTFDHRASELWYQRSANRHYSVGQELDGVTVKFAFNQCDYNSCPLTNEIAAAVTDEYGRYHLEVPIPVEMEPEGAPCVFWVEGIPGTDERDGILDSAGIPCYLLLRGKAKFWCGTPGFEEKNCLLDSLGPRILTFQNDPAVDRLSGVVQLAEDLGPTLSDTALTQNSTVRVEWDGALPGERVQNLTSGPSFGPATGSLVWVNFTVEGRPGCWDLKFIFAPEGSPLDGAVSRRPVCVSMATRAELELVGVTPGTLFTNDGSALNVQVRGCVVSIRAPDCEHAVPEDRVVNQPVHIMTQKGTTVRSVGTVVTNKTGYFTHILDLRSYLSGAVNIYAEYDGQTAPGVAGAYLRVPTSSQRVPVSLVLKPSIEFEEKPVVYRGEPALLNATLLNPFNRGIGTREVEVSWTGQTTFTEIATTDRQGRFRVERVISPMESPGTAALRVAFGGDADFTPTALIQAVEVRGRSLLTLFQGQTEKGQEAKLEGFLYDDTGRPLPGQKISLTWGTTHVGNATTNTLGYYAFPHSIPSEERVGPVTVRASFKGIGNIDGSNAQSTHGVLAATQLVLEQQEKRVQGGIEFSTKILDDGGHPIADQRSLDVFLAAARAKDQQYFTYLGPLDLSDALAPEAKLRHGYSFNSGFGISDGARLSVSLDQGKTWRPVTPRTGYPQPAIAALENGPGWSGTTTGWFPQRFNLSDYAREDDVRLRWRTGTSPLNNQVLFGLDNIQVRDGNRTLFSDDFERYGNKDTADYWTLPDTDAPGFVQGTETHTGLAHGVLATNLDGQYKNGVNALATSPKIRVEGANNFILLRYWLDVGNSGDYASVFLEEPATGKPSILQPFREPSYATLPETDGEWRWVLYELPGPPGRDVRVTLAFVSDGGIVGQGFMVDEFRILSGVSVAKAPILSTPDATRWNLSPACIGTETCGFRQGLLDVGEIDTYVAADETAATYKEPKNPETTFLKNRPFVKVETPFPVTLYGQPTTTLTVFPEGIVALGAFEQAISQGCRLAIADCTLNKLNLPTPVAAPFWDIDLVSTNATLATAAEGIAPNRVFVVEWRGLEAPGGLTTTTGFQVRFHENGDLEYDYRNVQFGDPRCDSDDAGDQERCMENGGHAVIGVVNAQGAQPVESYRRKPILADNYRIFYSHVDVDLGEGCVDTPFERCTMIPAISTGGLLTSGAAKAYGPKTSTEAEFFEGFDLTKSGEALLVIRHLVEMGRNDNLIVQGATGDSRFWRPLVALVGGQTETFGNTVVDEQGSWSTGVYDLTPLVGNKVRIRIQITSDATGQDFGAAIREMFVISGPRVFGTGNTYSFDSYLDTTRNGRTWWSARALGRGESVPPWDLVGHGADLPTELGSRYLRLGNGRDPLASSSEFFLTSPPLALAGSKAPVVEFWRNLQLPDRLDGAVLEISTDGGTTFRPLRPDGDAAAFSDFVPTLSGPGWSGAQFGLVTDTFDLTPYASKDLRLRLEFAAGDTPFSSRWILDDLVIQDRLKIDPATGKPHEFLAEDGHFTADRWAGTPGAWTPHALTTSVEHKRAGLEPITSVIATGSKLTHNVALPLGTPRGPLTATVLFPGVDQTYGGAARTSELVVELDTRIVGFNVHNLHDKKDYLVRNRTFLVEGIVQDREGAAVKDGLIHVELDGVVVASARTLDSGVFATDAVYLPPAYSLGNHRLSVKYAGDPANYILPSEAHKPVVVKGLTGLVVEKQVARGQDFRVTVRVLDDLGAPMPRTGILVKVDNGEPLEVVTDPQGRATFITEVPLEETTDVQYVIDALGTDTLLGQSMEATATVPPAVIREFPWLIAGAVAFVLVAAVILYVLFVRRHRRIHLAEELAKRIEAVEYGLATGDALRESIFELYRTFLKMLDRVGLARPATETPAELARALRANLPGALEPSIQTITQLFEEARYSEHALSNEERGRVQESLHQVRETLAPRMSNSPPPAGAPQ